MPGPTFLRGLEQWALSLDGTCPEQGVPRHRGIEPEVRDGLTPVNVHVFSMQNLTAGGLGPGISYREALWRYSARYAGGPVWVNVRCDLDSMIVRALARRLMRYRTQPATFDLGELCSVRAREGELRVKLTVAGTTVAGTPTPPSVAGTAREIANSRRMLTLLDGRAYEIPWGNASPVRTEHVDFQVERDTLGAGIFGAPVTWNTAHRVHDRAHACGLARELR